MRQRNGANIEHRNVQNDYISLADINLLTVNSTYIVHRLGERAHSHPMQVMHISGAFHAIYFTFEPTFSSPTFKFGENLEPVEHGRR